MGPLSSARRIGEFLVVLAALALSIFFCAASVLWSFPYVTVPSAPLSGMCVTVLVFFFGLAATDVVHQCFYKLPYEFRYIARVLFLIFDVAMLSVFIATQTSPYPWGVGFQAAPFPWGVAAIALSCALLWLVADVYRLWTRVDPTQYFFAQRHEQLESENEAHVCAL